MARRLDHERAARRDKVRAAPVIVEGGRPDPGWWWTVPKYAPRCADCSERAAGLVAYNHDLRLSVCGVCVPRRGVRPAMSKRAEAYIAAPSGTERHPS